MIDQELLDTHRVAARRITSKLSLARRRGKHISASDANELEMHRTAATESVEYVTESYNFYLYWAQKADETGKGIDVIRKHLFDAEKSRLKLKRFDVEKNKVRLSKEMLLRKKYLLPV